MKDLFREKLFSEALVFSENELINAINKKDFESEKVDGFKNKFFDDLDGKSSERVTDLILENLDI